METTGVRIGGEGLGNSLVTDVHLELTEALKGASLWDNIDYFEISMAMRKRRDALFPRFEWLSCSPVTSGGLHYVYVAAVFNGRMQLVFVAKTSKGFESACEVANRLARELGA